MAEREDIGALAIHFTAGIAAGTLLLRLPVNPYLLSGVFLTALSSSLFIPVKTGHSWTMLPIFLLLGAFCAVNGSFAGPDSQTALERLASAYGDRLRAFIDGIPFPSEGTASLLKAFLTGDRSGLSRSTVQVFRDSGASHLLALSGLHIGILYLLFSRLLLPLGNSLAARRFRYIITLGAAGFFTLMTGASPSIVRAFLFILLNETARLTGRQKSPFRILSTALLIQLVLSPKSITSVGFQLSYLAMAGIFLLYPRMERWYPESGRFDPFRRIWQAAALSVSCQVFTGPLAWYRFHTFPTFFLLTNLLAMPLTTLLMGTAVTTVALRGIGCCPGILIQVTDLLANGLVWILQVIASM